MSGVGKAHISSTQSGHVWFCFSCDDRIGTCDLGEPVFDLIRRQAMRVPFLNTAFFLGASKAVWPSNLSEFFTL